MKTRNTVLTALALAIFAVILWLADKHMGAYAMRILNLSAIYIVLSLSLNLVNGFTGLFSLGCAGFMAVGAYVSALLTMSPEVKEMNFFLEPLSPWLAHLTIPFVLALIAGGLCAALAGLFVGIPVLRLRDDYLAIATLGFSEIIRVVITNLQSLTNGAQGLKNIPKYSTTWTVWGVAAIVVAFMAVLTRSSYGRQLKAVRDDEIAAEAMGVNVFRVKVTSFTISSFLAGVGGALLGHMITTIDPKMFSFMLTFNILLIVVLGGNGSITGSVIASIAVTVLTEKLRFLDEPLNLLFFKTEGLPGLRMVVFSAMLMAVVIFRQRGLMGDKELTWDGLARLGHSLRGKKGEGEMKLETKGATMRFGGLTAVSDLNIEINKGEILGLIGPNGAGKTTAFNMITGVYAPTEGRIVFDGRDITGKKSHSITEAGIARTFQNIRLFSTMSVLENVLVGCAVRERPSWITSTLRTPGYRRNARKSRDFALELLEETGIVEHQADKATSLPYGKQRRLEIARALASRPSLLLLDEPAAGMNPQESIELMDFIRRVRDRFDLTILLIEHHMQVVMGICARMYVLDYGVTIASGTPDEIRKNQKVIEAYLGVE